MSENMNKTNANSNNANSNKMNATKVRIPCRISFANIWSPKSINGSEEKYSVSCIIPKSDTKTIAAINAAVEAAKETGKNPKMGRQDSHRFSL